jgi:hypothetical protein
MPPCRGRRLRCSLIHVRRERTRIATLLAETPARRGALVPGRPSPPAAPVPVRGDGAAAAVR